MEAFATAQIKELNQAKLFKSAYTAANLIQGAHGEALRWKQFRLEKARSLLGMSAYEPAVYELTQLVHAISAESQTYGIEDSVRSFNQRLSNQAKLLLAECHYKRKQFSAALLQFKAIPVRDHTLESMMLMAACAAQLENEYSAVKIYTEVLARWPFALEAAYELAKLGTPFDPLLSSREMAAAIGKCTTGAETVTDERTAFLGWIGQLYQDWNESLDSYRGGMPMWRAKELLRPETLGAAPTKADHEASPSTSTTAVTTSKDASDTTNMSTGEKQADDDTTQRAKSLKLSKPIRGADAMHTAISAMMELYEGDMEKTIAIFETARGSIGKLLGVEYLGWCRLRLGHMDELRELQMLLGKQYPSNWETWFVSALREWIGDPARRNVNGALEMLTRAQLAAPTNTLLLVARGYMQAYKVKDCILRLAAGTEAEMVVRRQMMEATKASIESLRDAWQLSKDPFVTYSLLHVYTSLSPILPESKIIEVVADVDALNPLMKRFKTNPQQVLSQASNNRPLSSIYARLLAKKAKLCSTKTGLIQIAIDTAASAKSFDSENILAQAVTIAATAAKSTAPTDQTMKQLNELLRKAETIEDINTVRAELLQLLSTAGLLDRSKEICEAYYESNKMSEDAIYWSEDTRMKLERLNEEEDEEDGELDDEGM